MTVLDLFLMFTALGGVVALMVGLGMLVRRMGLTAGWSLPAGPGAADKRLEVLETLALSATHRAIILRMDQTDHLVVLGPNGQSVVNPNQGPPHERPGHDV